MFNFNIRERMIIYRVDIIAATYNNDNWDYCAISDFYLFKKNAIKRQQELCSVLEDIKKKHYCKSDCPTDEVWDEWAEFISRQIGKVVYDVKAKLPMIRKYNLKF